MARQLYLAPNAGLSLANGIAEGVQGFMNARTMMEQRNRENLLRQAEIEMKRQQIAMQKQKFDAEYGSSMVDLQKIGMTMDFLGKGIPIPEKVQNNLWQSALDKLDTPGKVQLAATVGNNYIAKKNSSPMGIPNLQDEFSQPPVDTGSVDSQPSGTVAFNKSEKDILNKAFAAQTSTNIAAGRNATQLQMSENQLAGLAARLDTMEKIAVNNNDTALKREIERTRREMNITKIKAQSAKEIQDLRNKGQIDVQGYRNEGSANVAGINAGSREKTAKIRNKGALDVANVQADARVESAGISADARKATAGAKGGAADRIAINSVKSIEDQIKKLQGTKADLYKPNSLGMLMMGQQEAEQAKKIDAQIGTLSRQREELLKSIGRKDLLPQPAVSSTPEAMGPPAPTSAKKISFDKAAAASAPAGTLMDTPNGTMQKGDDGNWYPYKGN